MKRKITDMRFLTVVNGYSLTAIIALLERWNLLVATENGTKNELTGKYNFFYENGGATYDEEIGKVRYCLEYDAIDVMEVCLQFYGSGSDGLRSKRLKYEIVLAGEHGYQIATLNYTEFFHLYPDKFAGLTLKEWQDIFDIFFGFVVERIQVFIPEFTFDLVRLHRDDRPAIKSDVYCSLKKFKEDNGAF